MSDIRIPTNGIPGVEILPFWQAKYYTPNSIVEVRAIVWHFAQGGATDTWLTHPTNDNSSHLVLKYSGAVRQMVDFTDASHSLHVSFDDDSFDASNYGIFGIDFAKNALGTGFANPNRYLIAIEVEGFAAEGPNEAQKKTVLALARYLERQFPNAVHLGHRDFQDYKPCPGPYLFRGLLPHAGRLETEVPALKLNAMTAARGVATVKTDVPHAAIRVHDRGLIWLPGGTRKAYVAKAKLDTPWPNHPSGDVYVVGDTEAVLLAEDVTVQEEKLYTPAEVDAIVATSTSTLRATLRELRDEAQAVAAILTDQANKLTT